MGYIGIEGAAKGGTTISGKNPDEPVKTLDKIVRFFGLEEQKAAVRVDSDLVENCLPPKNKNEFRQIWKHITSEEHIWAELKAELIKLLRLGDSMLPLVFDIIYHDVHIEVIDGEDTISVTSKDFSKLKCLKTVLEKEADKRVTPYAQIGTPKLILSD